MTGRDTTSVLCVSKLSRSYDLLCSTHITYLLCPPLWTCFKPSCLEVQELIGTTPWSLIKRHHRAVLCSCASSSRDFWSFVKNNTLFRAIRQTASMFCIVRTVPTLYYQLWTNHSDVKATRFQYNCHFIFTLTRPKHVLEPAFSYFNDHFDKGLKWRNLVHTYASAP